MATAISSAKQETPGTSATAETYVVKPAAPASAPAAPASDRPGTDPMDFVRAGKIHVRHGSLFIDPYLVVHPKELAPENEERLRAKLNLTYSINNPSFYESADRVAIALNLGQLVPVSLDAKRSKLVEEVKQFNAQIDSGADAELSQQAKDKREPFAAIVRDTMEQGEADPVGMELLKNGLSIYLLIREKLTQQRYLNKLTDYVTRNATPDQVLADLGDKIGFTPQQVREAALNGGVDGVGQLLGLDPKYVADVKRLTEYASTQDFGYNIIEHWHLGRQLIGIDGSIEDKIATGMDARITAKIAEYRGRVRNFYDVPPPIAQEEARIASEVLSLVEPIQRQLMMALDYEFGYTPENTADEIAFYKGVYGLHRKAANDLKDYRGTYRIYFSGHGDPAASAETGVHEIAHVFWPDHFTPQDVARIDQLASSDAQYFTALDAVLDQRYGEFTTLLAAYKAGSAEEKQAVVAAADEQFGLRVGHLFQHIQDPATLRFMVQFTKDTLHVEGDRYNRSGYVTPQERFREVISRYAGAKQVRYRAQAELFKALTPGLSEIWDQHYIPHLERVYQDLQIEKQKAGNPMTVPSVTGQADNVVQLAVSANDELPKVEERITPKPETPGQAAADEAPDNKVHSQGLVRNAQTLAAFEALQDLGINVR